MEKETRPFISWQLADDFMTAVFEKMGVPTEDARLCADVLLEQRSIFLKRHRQLQFLMLTMVWEW